MNTGPDNAEVASRFTLVAATYCAVVDSAPGLDRAELLTKIYQILPQLISEGISLPDVELNDSISEEEEKIESLAREKVTMSYPEWSKLYHSLQEKIGDWNLYWEIFDPTKDTEAINGSLADDIADIYHDLKPGLILAESCQASPEDNIWHWRAMFYSHWGHHAIDALRMIHVLLEDINTFGQPS